MVGSSGPGPTSAAESASRSPAPRRLRAPSWLNFRLIAGVLLVLVSVVVGARIVTAADNADMVWAADADLAVGTVLTSEDVRTVSVRLSEVGAAYLRASVDPVGRVLSGSVRAGELLPLSVLEENSTLVDIALPIAAGYVPPTLRRGQLVDVYALDATPTSSPADIPSPVPGQTGVPEAPQTPEEGAASGVVSVVVQAAVVQLIAGRSDGALSIGSSTIQVVISIEAAQAVALFAAITGRELALAVRSSTGPAPAAGSEPPAGRSPTTPVTATPTPTP